MPIIGPELRELYPFESRYFDIDGVRMHYVDEGDGPPVLMLHGNPTWSFHYREFIKSLRDRYRVIAPDHIGCGLSDKPSGYRYTLANHIANVERLVEHLKLTGVTLLVHDWGGAIGFGWATRHPALVSRFVVLNTAAFTGFEAPLRIRICRWPWLGAFLVRGLNGFLRSSFRMAVTRPLHSRVRRGYLLPYDSYASRVAIHQFVRDIPLGSSHPTYATLLAIEERLGLLAEKPMLILWGGRDFCFNDRFLDQWRRRFPNADVHRFADAGHYVVEDAGDRMLPLIEHRRAIHNRHG